MLFNEALDFLEPGNNPFFTCGTSSISLGDIKLG